MNRPIDGIDLDGLEWIHYKVQYQTGLNGKPVVLSKSIEQDFRNRSEQTMNELHGTSKFYTKFSKGFGSKGQGVLYTYEQVDDAGSIASSFEQWDVEESLTRHGFYYGSGAITNFGQFFTPRKHGNYNFNVAPLDMTDALAREHDKLQDKPGYKGFMHIDYIYSDILFVQKLKKFLGNAEEEGYKDPFTGRPPSKEAIDKANNAVDAFSNIIAYKIGIIEKKFEKGKISREEYNRRKDVIGKVFYLSKTAPLPTTSESDK